MLLFSFSSLRLLGAASDMDPPDPRVPHPLVGVAPTKEGIPPARVLSQSPPCRLWHGDGRGLGMGQGLGICKGDLLFQPAECANLRNLVDLSQTRGSVPTATRQSVRCVPDRDRTLAIARAHRSRGLNWPTPILGTTPRSVELITPEQISASYSASFVQRLAGGGAIPHQQVS